MVPNLLKDISAVHGPLSGSLTVYCRNHTARKMKVVSCPFCPSSTLRLSGALVASSCSHVEVGPCFSLHTGPLEAINSLPGALSPPRHRARDPNPAFEVQMNYERHTQCRREQAGALKVPGRGRGA